jgi:hypothetical protein
MPWFCFGLCAIALLILHWRKWRRALWAALAMLPSVGFAMAAYIEERHAHSYFKRGDDLSSLEGKWHDFPQLLAEFPGRVMELFPGNADRNMLIVLFIALIVICFLDGTHREDETRTEARQPWLILWVLFFAYGLLPYTITRPMSWWYVSPRVPSMMAPVIALLPATRFERWKKLLLVPVVLVAIALPFTLVKLYRSFSARNAGFMRLVEETPRGARVLVVVRGMMRGPGSEELSGDPATSAPVYWHFSSWPMALHGGYAPYVFDQGIPIVPKFKLQQPSWTQTDLFEMRQAPEFDYYIVRSPSDDMEREPSLKVTERFGEWVLLKRIHKLTEEP